MRIANHSLFLKPTVMYLTCFADKGAERKGEVGTLFQQLRDLCLVGECQQLTSCKHSFDTLFRDQGSGQDTSPRAQTQRSQGANGQLPCPLTCTSLPLTPQELLELDDASSPELGVLWAQPDLDVTPTEGTQGGTV